MTIKKDDASQYCLAIENKPYAADQESQIARYLEHLTENYAEKNWLLIYLPPRRQAPSESSFPEAEYQHGKWKCRFKIMPYHSGIDSESDEDESSNDASSEQKSIHSDAKELIDDYRMIFSLNVWLSECRKMIEVDRLRWFLLDMQRFIEKQFGGVMVTDNETQALEECIFSDQKNLNAARLIHSVWPDIATKVYGKFLQVVAESFKERINNDTWQTGSMLPESIKNAIEIDYNPGNRKSPLLYCGWYLTSNEWQSYDGGTQESAPTFSRIRVGIESQAHDGNSWAIGIISPRKVINHKLRPSKSKHDELVKKLQLETRLQQFGLSRVSEWWPSYKLIQLEYGNWNELIPKLHAECNKKDDNRDITDYFVNELFQLVEIAFPIIDEIEGKQPQPGD